MRRVMLVALWAPLLLGPLGCGFFGQLPGQGKDRGKAVIYRDTWGVPHIYAPTVEAGSYAMGWAQAHDRPEELLKNFLRGIGEVSLAEGEGGFLSDVRARMWDNYGVAQRNAERISAKSRRMVQAYVDGVNDYYAANPADAPTWWGDRKVDEAMVTAFGRLFLHNWSIDDAYDDLKRAGIRARMPEYERGSNQFAVSPARSAEGAAILLIDPHLSWWGASRFWEFRIHADDFVGSGFTLAAFPTIGLGHNENLAWAMTTGGPDTADVYELTLKPDDPTMYMYDGEYRKLAERVVEIQVKGEAAPRTLKLFSSHHGPIIAVKEGKAYAAKVSYAEEVQTTDAWNEMIFGKDYRGAVRATETLQIFPQNVMVADTSGNIYYQRTGRVPVRPDGFDFSKPVDGSTSKSEWTGLHPSSDLVQTLNPPQGYMQNCNIPPDAMMVDSPFDPAKITPEIFSDLSHGPRGGWSNQRGARAVELLAADSSVTAEEARAYALDVHPYGVERWLAPLRIGDEKFGKELATSNPDYAAGIQDILAWNGELEADSTGALKYYYWRQQMIADFGAEPMSQIAARINNVLESIGKTSPQPQFTDDELRGGVNSFVGALAKIKANHGRVDAEYGEVFRVGRDDASFPSGGGGPRELDMTTLRNVGYGGEKPDHTRWGQSGQTSTQIIVLSKPIRSWTQPPIGQSDRKDSPHYRDQAEKLFSERKMKSTWWTPKELSGHIESREELAEAPKKPFWKVF